MPVIPLDRKDTVAALTAEGLTDELIGLRFGCTGSDVHQFRKLHGIEKKRGAPPPRPAPIAVGPLKPIRTYYDPAVNFLVKVFPPRHASGDIDPFDGGYM